MFAEPVYHPAAGQMNMRLGKKTLERCSDALLGCLSLWGREGVNLTAF
jgi:hypothetical protein